MPDIIKLIKEKEMISSLYNINYVLISQLKLRVLENTQEQKDRACQQPKVVQ